VTESDAATTPEALLPAASAFEDAHELWHDAADAYHDPAEFRRRAEALIQATRNVTWRLQSSRSELPQFDDWYPGWQDLMRADERLQWLNDARIDVVKRGGLRAESFAVVRIIDSYLEPKKQLLRLPAATATTDLVGRAQRKIPEEFRPHIAIEVSRRWVAEDRPEELLWLIGYCLHVLDALLLFAREATEAGLPVESPAEFLDLVLYPDCMLFDPSWFPLLFEADTGDEFDFGFAERTVDVESVERIAKRYRVKKGSIEATDPIERAMQVHDLARALFKRDGYYAPIVELGGPEPRDAAVFSTLPTDKRFKFLMWHALGREVRVKGYTSVIATTEIWMAPLPENVQPYHDAESAPDRKEALVTWVDTQAADARQIVSPIVRALGKPFLKSAREEAGRTEDGFLSPIHRAWSERPSNTGVRPSSASHETGQESAE
jgi:hypothetical protein